MPFPTDGGLPAYGATPIPSTPPPAYHAHPLRSHRHTKVFVAQAETKSDRPDSGILHPAIDTFGHHGGPRMPAAPSRNDHPAFRRASITPMFTSPIPPQERFGHPAHAGAASADIPIIPTRPPLRPTVSFGSVSRYSYYSNSSTNLDYKSMVIAAEEERRSQQNIFQRQHWRFLACFVSLCVLNLACGLSTTACSITLPMMATSLDLNSVQTFWVPGSFLLLAFLTQPLAMRLSLAVGCKSLLILNLLLFTGGSIGSALSKHATSILASRGLQGAGAGAICVLTQLALNQLVTAAYRRQYERCLTLAFWFGAVFGPMIGGPIMESEAWRRSFGIQVVFGALGLLAIPLLLQLPYVDAGYLLHRLMRVDYLGWILLTASIAPLLIAISWAGTIYPWSSWHVLVPMIICLISMAFWTAYNLYRHEPILPISIFRSASAAVSCFGALVHGMLFTTAVFFLPLTLQISEDLLPWVTRMALTPFTLTLFAMALAAGFINHWRGYRWSIWGGWALATVSFGLVLVLQTTKTAAASIPVGIVCGMALGLLAPSLASAVQSAASNDDESIHASPLHLFFGTLGQCLGVVVSSSILLNRLSHRVDALDAIANLPTILAMTAEQAAERRSLADSYLDALRPVWILMCALAGLAFFTSVWFTEDHRPRRQRESTVL